MSREANTRAPQADNETLRRIYEAPTAEGAAIRDEFPSLEAFSAYWRARQRGKVKIVGGTVVSL